IRVAFLYVGQGSSTVVLVKDGAGYRVLLIDSNLDERNGGINVPKLIRDLASNGLYAFVNTHPHDDHLKGVKQISEAVTIENVWHSGHVPSKKYGTYHKDLAKLIRDVEKRNGASAIREIIDSPSPES